MIKVGEYVRINKDFRISCIGIGKVVNKSNDAIYVKMSNNNLPISFNINNIVKHKSKLIELLEEGDYVNGYRILAMEDSIYENSKRILIYKNQKERYERWIYIQEHDGRIHTQDDIVEILTKEQYEANCYKVEEE